MSETVSIAIETSSRVGGVALGVGGELVQDEQFDASARHAAQLISQLSQLLENAGLRPPDVKEVYVSLGPGSFTGIRIGVTVARTLAQGIPNLHCVGVSTTVALAHNARELAWENLGVVLAAKRGRIYSALFARDGEQIVPGPAPTVTTAEAFLENAPRPMLLMGEAIEYESFTGSDITIADPSLYTPTPRGVWEVGREMASKGEFTEAERLLPIYAHEIEAVRLWEHRKSDR